MNKEATIKPSLNLLSEEQSHILKWLPQEELSQLTDRVLNMSEGQYNYLKHNQGLHQQQGQLHCHSS